MTIRETLAEGTRLLKSPSPSSFIDTPALDAALLLAEVLHSSREELIIRGNDPITESDRDAFSRLISKRRNGECVAYILGRREFRGLEFSVNPHVLVPRPDTETLVEAALEYIDSRRRADTPPDHEQGEHSFSLLDLCTGSGAVAISLASALKNEYPFLRVCASDISPEALETAALNAARLLDGRLSDDNRNSVRFIHSDIFENIPDKFNIIVSNPPYVPSAEISTLAPEVRREPILALDGGADGLELIRRIISQAPEHLLPGGILLLEAGAGQMQDICLLLETHHFTSIRIHKDLAGRDRVISGEVQDWSPNTNFHF